MLTITIRARTGFMQTDQTPDAKRQAIRQSLSRYYRSRTDPTRTRAARREARALQQARILKYAR